MGKEGSSFLLRAMRIRTVHPHVMETSDFENKILFLQKPPQKMKCCNYNNETLSDMEWDRIETQCKKQRHLETEDNLKDLIARDEKAIASHGLSFEQLGLFFEKLKLHFAKEVNEKKEHKLTSAEVVLLKKHALGGSGWSSWASHVATIFNGKLVVARYTWGGAETCPFQSSEDDGYHGYEYGSHDWIFIRTDKNESMHIGDLLFHQITKHHFFQSPSSGYRVDPSKLISFFDLRKDVDYQTETITKDMWRSRDSTSCLRRFNKERTYSLKDAWNAAKHTDLKRQQFGTNEVYSNDKVCFVVVNKFADGLPALIDNIQLNYQQTEDVIGVFGYDKGEFTEITEHERSRVWL